MKKIHISNFRKKHGTELFSLVSDAVRKSNCDNHVIKNSSVNIAKIIQQLPETEIKTKFVNWASGYDFAVIDVV